MPGHDDLSALEIAKRMLQHEIDRARNLHEQRRRDCKQFQQKIREGKAALRQIAKTLRKG
jgi:hypothetical protein